MIEINNILYRCPEELAKFFEYLRFEKTRVRVVYDLGGASFQGYIRPSYYPYPHPNEDKPVYRPTIVWRAGVKTGRDLLEGLVVTIESTSPKELLYTRSQGVLIEYSLPLDNRADNSRSTE